MTCVQNRFSKGTFTKLGFFSPVNCKGEGPKGQIKELEDKAKGRRWGKGFDVLSH